MVRIPMHKEGIMLRKAINKFSALKNYIILQTGSTLVATFKNPNMVTNIGK